MDVEYGKQIGAAIDGLWARLEGIRSGSSWERKLLAASYLHHRDDYLGTGVERRQTYDTSAIEFLSTFHDGFVGYLTPEDDNWAELVPMSVPGKAREERKEYADIEALDGVKGLLPYAEKLSSAVLSEYTDSPYYEQESMAAWDWLIFAVAYMMAVDDPKDKRVSYVCFDPQEVCIAENGRRKVDVFVRKFRMDAEDVVRMWPDALLPNLRAQVRAGGGERSEVVMYEAILPKDYLWSNGERLEVGDGRDFAHLIWCQNEGTLVVNSGYDRFPVACVRYERTNSVSPYGRSLAEKNLDTIIQLDDMEKERQIMFQKNVNPPMAVPNALEGRYSSRPGMLNFVSDINQRPVPIMEGFGYTQMLSDIQDKREQLRASLKADLFRNVMAMTDSRKTAYEVSERKNEAMTLLMMSIGSFKRELINPLFMRTLEILNAKKRLPSLEAVYADNQRRTGKAVPARTFTDFLDNCRIELSSVFVQRISAYLQYEGLMAGLNIFASVSEIFPTARFQVYEDKLTRHLMYACAFPKSLIRPRDAAKKAEDDYAARQMEMMQAQQNLQNAQANKNQAEALNALREQGATA